MFSNGSHVPGDDIVIPDILRQDHSEKQRWDAKTGSYYFASPKLWLNLQGTFDLDQATNRRKTA